MSPMSYPGMKRAHEAVCYMISYLN